VNKLSFADIDTDVADRLSRRFEKHKIAGLYARSRDPITRVALIERGAGQWYLKVTVNIHHQT